MLNLGLNDVSIKYEVALEVLGQEMQPLMNQIALEKKKEKVSEPTVNYLTQRLNAIKNLQHELRPQDVDTVNQILDSKNTFFRL